MKFGVQTFLNPVDSVDSGYIKFSIMPNGYGEAERKKYFGHTITWQIADCSKKVYLEFDGWHGYDHSGKGLSKHSVRSRLKTLRGRRKKLQLFVDSVNSMAEKVFQAMDEDEAFFQAVLDK